MRTRWVLWYGVAVHSLWAGLLLTSPEAAHTTPLGIFAGIPRWLVAAGMLVAITAATAGLMQRTPGRRSLGLLLPQQALLLLTAWSASGAVLVSAYADGVTRSRVFIAADQMPIVLLVSIHTLALIEMHVMPIHPRPPNPSGGNPA
jgi:hypothetical protein